VSELTDVLEAIESLHARGERMALATIVAVKGSTYRGPGARLLVSADGEMVGNISGGCLEGDVAEVARVVMVEGEPRIASFDLTSDDEAVWGWGLGCNGAIEVFVEPADRAAEAAGALRRALEEERPLASVTVLGSATPGVERGARLLVGPDGRREGGLGSAEADDAAAATAGEQLAAGRSEVRELPGGIRAFVEVLDPPLRLVICGAGHDAIPLVELAARLGWKPIVVDDRERFLNAERFPSAASFVRVDRPADAAAAVGVDERTPVIVMSHNYLRDLEYVRGFLGTPAPYLGVLGPAVRRERLLADLRRDGVEPSPEDLSKLHGPAGLDLGGDGPEEIAAAIVAEVMAVRHGRAAGYLRDRTGPIHERSEDSGAWR
jgi:xanthine/CO dehydrogenase XdhC/CoxF family maturation factor